MTTETLFARFDPIVRQFVEEMVARDDTAPMPVYAACAVVCAFMTALREANNGRPELLTTCCLKVGEVPDGIASYPDPAVKAT